MSEPTEQTVPLDSATSVVEARRFARAYAAELGLSRMNQTRFATAVSEIARNAVLYAHEGRLHIGYKKDPVPAVVATVRDSGPGIEDLDAVLADTYKSERGLGRGLSGTRALVDEMRIETAPTGTMVELVKYVGAKSLPKAIATVDLPRPTVPKRADPLDDLREQNDALLTTIAELSEAEQRLRISQNHLQLAVDVAGIGTFLCMQEGLLEADERCCAQHGAEELRSVEDLIAAIDLADRDSVRATIVDVVQGGGDSQTEYRTNQGRALAVRLQASTKDQQSSCVAAVLDVTDLRQAEEDARARVRFQQQLIGIVSHDLRSPLQVVSTGASMLPEFGELNEGQLRAVRNMESSADRAARLVQDLLDFAKSSLGGRLPVAPASMDLGVLAKRIADETQSIDASYLVDLKSEGDLTGTWDADRLAQVLTNLLHNALSYSPEGSIVELSVRAIDDEQVELSVANEGEPVPAEILPGLFEPLHERAKVRSSKLAAGVGLGLYIVRAIAVAHGGTVTATSSHDEGTQITLRLPRHCEAPPR